MKWLLVIGILLVFFCAARGFVASANELGWDGSLGASKRVASEATPKGVKGR